MSLFSTPIVNLFLNVKTHVISQHFDLGISLILPWISAFLIGCLDCRHKARMKNHKEDPTLNRQNTFDDGKTAPNTKTLEHSNRIDPPLQFPFLD